MRLQGAPPDGEIALSYVTDPQGTIVGSAERPIGHILPLPGQTGPQGPSNVLSIGTVAKGPAAGATITGTSPTQSLNLVLPQGDKGDKGDQGIQGATGPTDWNLITNKPDLSLKEDKANKGAANGYAPLGSDSKVPAANLPSYVDDVLDFANLAAFPATGEAGKIYVADDTNKTYRWNTGSSAYIEISASPGSTDGIAEGTVNKYYTDARADARVVAGITGKADKTTTVSAGTGLTGGGDLSAPRTLAVSYGSTAGTAAQGNDSRLSDQRTPLDNSVTSAKIVDGTIALTDLSATGTKSSSTFLRGDNTWGTPPGASASGINLEGTFASLPAAGTQGRVYVCTDVGLILYDNGTTWDRVWGGPLNGLTAPPSTGWTTTTLGTATIAADKDGRLLTIPASNGGVLRYEYRTLSPASGYTATAYFEYTGLGDGNKDAGLLLTNGSLFVVFGIGGGSGVLEVRSSKWSTTTAGTANYFEDTIGTQITRIPNWFRIVDDGTNRLFKISYNGVDWVTAFSVGRTDFVTPTSVGWGGESGSAAQTLIRCRSFTVTTP